MEQYVIFVQRVSLLRSRGQYYTSFAFATSSLCHLVCPPKDEQLSRCTFGSRAEDHSPATSASRILPGDTWMYSTNIPTRRSAILRCVVVYVGFESESNNTILCNGDEMCINDNLNSFLQQCRRVIATSIPRKLWIDAICINQLDIKEKNHQVAQMGDIYTNATSTIAWLGDASDSDTLAFSVVQDRGKIDLPGHINTGPPWKAWELCSEVPRKPYWRRIWIIQECALASKLSLWCGDLQADGDDFFETHRNSGNATLGLYPMTVSTGRTVLGLRRQCRRGLESYLHFALGSLLMSFGGSQARDSRDSVYALLGIAQCTDIVADYSKSQLEIAEETCRDYELQWRRKSPYPKTYQENSEFINRTELFMSCIHRSLKIA